jgi:hypothetical protein
VDIDSGGLRIFSYIEEIVSRPSRPHLMMRDLAERHGRPCEPNDTLAQISKSESASRSWLNGWPAVWTRARWSRWRARPRPDFERQVGGDDLGCPFLTALVGVRSARAHKGRLSGANVVRRRRRRIRSTSHPSTRPFSKSRRATAINADRLACSIFRQLRSASASSMATASRTSGNCRKSRARWLGPR